MFLDLLDYILRFIFRINENNFMWGQCFSRVKLYFILGSKFTLFTLLLKLLFNYIDFKIRI